jgi:hypothetical protein
MILSIPDTAPAALAANLAPTSAVKSTSDIKSAAPVRETGSVAGGSCTKGPSKTLQISTAAQTALQESKDTQAPRPPRRSLTFERQAVKLLAKETAST